MWYLMTERCSLFIYFDIRQGIRSAVEHVESNISLSGTYNLGMLIFNIFLSIILLRVVDVPVGEWACVVCPLFAIYVAISFDPSNICPISSRLSRRPSKPSFLVVPNLSTWWLIKCWDCKDIVVGKIEGWYYRCPHTRLLFHLPPDIDCWLAYICTIEIYLTLHNIYRRLCSTFQTILNIESHVFSLELA